MKYYFEYIARHQAKREKELKQDNIDLREYNYIIDRSFYFFHLYFTRKEELKELLKTRGEFNTEYQIKNIVQSSYPFSTTVWFKELDYWIDKYKKEIFDFLNKQKEPYKWIFYNHYEFKTDVSDRGYYPYKANGVNDITLLIATEYAKHIIKKPHL